MRCPARWCRGGRVTTGGSGQWADPVRGRRGRLVGQQSARRWCARCTRRRRCAGAAGRLHDRRDAAGRAVPEMRSSMRWLPRGGGHQQHAATMASSVEQVACSWRRGCRVPQRARPSQHARAWRARGQRGALAQATESSSAACGPHRPGDHVQQLLGERSRFREHIEAGEEGHVLGGVSQGRGGSGNHAGRAGPVIGSVAQQPPRLPSPARQH